MESNCLSAVESQGVSWMAIPFLTDESRGATRMVADESRGSNADGGFLLYHAGEAR